jgi:hypothetical protein
MECTRHPEGCTPVVSESEQPVVILYEHALLGEGIAKYLAAQLGTEATVESMRHPEAVRSALALGPSVVIFESSHHFQQHDLARLAPHAVLIDVSTVITRGSVVSPCAAGLAQILQAVCASSRNSGHIRSGPTLSM